MKDRKLHRYDTIDTETGEIVNTAYTKGKLDKLTILTEEQTNYLEMKKRQNELYDELKKNGRYIHSYFILQEPYMKEIQNRYKGTYANIHIVRFLVLSTYVDKNGYLVKDRNKLRQSSLSEIWGLDISNVKKEVKMLEEINYIRRDEDNYIRVNTSIVNKGKANKDTTYNRIFCLTLRELYNNCPKNKRSQLAYLYKALPYVNLKYNILCSNPQENDIEKMEKLGWKELCIKCGYNIAMLKRFKDALKQYKTKDGDYLIAKVEIGDTDTLIINPKLYYGGNNIEELNYIIDLFDSSKLPPKK